MSPIPYQAIGFKPPPRGVDLPSEDGEPMESERHRTQASILLSSLKLAWKARDDFFAGANMFVYYSELQAKKNDFRGPDFFVVLGARRGPSRRSWVVWEEDGRTPDVVIELLSPSTEPEDRGAKMDIYARLLRVPEYYLYDPWDYRLEGYELCLETKTYRPMVKDKEGRYWSKVMGLGLAVVESEFEQETIPWLRWTDAEGRVIPHVEEWAKAEAARAEASAQEAEAERQKAEAEHQRAEDALARLAELERRMGKSSD